MNVFLVEDSEADVELLTELFSRHDAVKLDHAYDGSAALDYIYRRGEHKDASRPDVILLDLSLPRVGGFDVLRILKNDSRLAGIPVIMLTTCCNPTEREQCKSLGAEMFLSKPLSLKGYEELVRMLITIDFPRVTNAARRAG